MEVTLLADVVTASDEVAQTSSRSRKIAIIAELLRRVAPAEVATVAGFLSGVPRQGRVGVGHSTIYSMRVEHRGRAVAHGRRPGRGDRRIQDATGSGLSRTPARDPRLAAGARDRSRGELHPPALHRGAAPGRAGRADGGCDREGRRRGRRARAAGAHAVGRPSRHRPARACRGRRGPARRRLPHLPAHPPDAGLDGGERRERARGIRARVGRVEAGRDPHPDPPPRRRRARLHAQPERHHAHGSPHGGRDARAARRAGGAGRRGALARQGEPDLPLRRSPSRRRGSARRPARAARRAARRRRARAEGAERDHVRAGGGTAPPRRGARARGTRAWS